MRLLTAALLLAATAAPASAGTPPPLRIAVDGLVAGPALTTDGVAWAQISGGRTEVRVQTGAGAQNTLASLPWEQNDESGFPAPDVPSLSTDGDRVAFVTGEPSGERGVGSAYASSDLVLASADGTTTRNLVRCGGAPVPAAVALGAGFTVIRACTSWDLAATAPRTADVSVDGGLVGRGVDVQAAGRFAAWWDANEGSGTLHVLDTATGVEAEPRAVAAAWTIDERGTAYTVGRGADPGSAVVVATPLGEPSQVVAAEPRAIDSLSASAGTLAYVTASGHGDRQQVDVVAVVGGVRRVLTRAWTGDGPPARVVTDGRRVAWSVSACGGSTITLTTVDAPPSDERAGACPLRFDHVAMFTSRTVIVFGLDAGPGPARAVVATLRLSVHGRTIATGTVRTKARWRYQSRLRLTPVGRRLVHDDQHATLTAVRQVGHRHRVSSRDVLLWRG